MINFSFKGIGVLKNRIEKANTSLESIMYNVLENEANYIQTMSVLNAPHKTGALRGSQYKEPERGKNKLVYKIGFKKLYGVYQEFGTGKVRFTKEYQEFSTWASQWQLGKPIIPVRANRYFLHYFVVSRKRLSRETNKIFKRLLK